MLALKRYSILFNFQAPFSESITSSKSSANSQSVFEEEAEECHVVLLKYDSLNNTVLVALSYGSIIALGYKKLALAIIDDSGNSHTCTYKPSLLYDIQLLDDVQVLNDTLSQIQSAGSSRSSMGSYGSFGKNSTRPSSGNNTDFSKGPPSTKVNRLFLKPTRV
jgi:hypothetical protein